MQYFKLLFACWFLLLLSPASANNEILITDSAVKLDRFELDYFIDQDQQLTLTEVQKQSFTPSSSHFSFGTSAKTLWLKFSLQNETDTAKTLFLHQNTAYHNRQIDLYQFNRDGLQRQQHIDLDCVFHR